MTCFHHGEWKLKAQTDTHASMLCLFIAVQMRFPKSFDSLRRVPNRPTYRLRLVRPWMFGATIAAAVPLYRRFRALEGKTRRRRPAAACVHRFEKLINHLLARIYMFWFATFVLPWWLGTITCYDYDRVLGGCRLASYGMWTDSYIYLARMLDFYFWAYWFNTLIVTDNNSHCLFHFFNKK